MKTSVNPQAAHNELHRPVGETRPMKFNLSGLSPRFDEYAETGPELTIEALAVPLRMHDIPEQLHEAGFTDHEVDALIDEFIDGVQVRLISKMLASRRVR